MATYVQNLLNNVLGDGARPSKFDVEIVFPPELFPDAQGLATLAKATSFPGKSHDKIDFKYKGRTIPLKGQGKYEQSWECTFYLTEDHKLKNAVETWIESLDQKHNYFTDTAEIPNLQTMQEKNSVSYVTNVLLYQKNFDGDQNTAIYELYNVFPTEVTKIEYNAESVGDVLEFTVTFSYSHYKSVVIKAPEGNFIDGLVDKFKKGAKDLVQGLIGNIKDKIVNSSIVKSANTKLDELKQFVSGESDMKDTIDKWL